MNVILYHNHYDPDHLTMVEDQMKTLGAPEIVGIWMECWDCWVAVEGCHRLRAAAALGITPIMTEATSEFLEAAGETAEGATERATKRQMLTF